MPPRKKMSPELIAMLDLAFLPSQTITSEAVTKAIGKLSPQKSRFVTAHAGGLRAVDAMMQSGWRGKRSTAASAACRLLKDDVDVKLALDLLRGELITKAAYDHEAFMKELDDTVKFAQQTRNATAMARAVELRGKANGHLVEKTENKNINAGFSLTISGLDPIK